MFFLYTGWLTYTCLSNQKVFINDSPFADKFDDHGYRFIYCNWYKRLKATSMPLIVYSNVTTAGNNQLILSNTTANGTNRSLLDFTEFNDAELASYRLRCGVRITFVLATGFVAAARFYFGDRASWGYFYKISYVCTVSINAENLFSPGTRYRSIRILGANDIAVIRMSILYLVLPKSTEQSSRASDSRGAHRVRNCGKYDAHWKY